MKLLISDAIDKSALNWLHSQKIEFEYSPEIDEEKLLKEIFKYEGLVVRSRTKVTKGVIEKGTKLKAIGRVGTGVDNIDLKSAYEKQIKVVNAKGANSQAVAEHTIGLMLALLRKYRRGFSSMEKGLWDKKNLKGEELRAKTIGVLGSGDVGGKVIELLKAFGAKVLVFNRGSTSKYLEEIFRSADIVTIHLSLNEETEGLVNKKLLSLLKPSAYLINTSRGKIIDEPSLVKILKAGKIAGAALDVFDEEPLSKASELRKLDKVILTPHIGAATKEAFKQASLLLVEDIVRAIKGQKIINEVKL